MCSLLITLCHLRIALTSPQVLFYLIGEDLFDMSKLFRIFLIGMTISLLLSKGSIAQSRYGRMQLGVYSMIGNSAAIIPQSSSLNNQINDHLSGFVAYGFYYFIQLRNDSIYNTGGFLRFMRVDFGMTNRAGIFELNPGDYAKLNAQGLDLAVLLPLSFKAADEIDAYCAVGPVFSYRYSWVITPSQVLPKVDDFKAGFAVELGFRLKSGSAIGYRTMTDFGGGFSSFRVGSVFFAFSPQNAPKRRPQRKKF